MTMNKGSINTVNNKNYNSIFIMVMSILPLIACAVALILFLTGVIDNYYPNWLVVILLVDLFLFAIFDLILLKSNEVEFTEPLVPSVFCFPLYVYLREKMTDNNKIVFIFSIMSYVVAIYIFIMNLLSNEMNLGDLFTYVFVIYALLALLMKLFSNKNDNNEIVYTVYMLQTVILLIVVIAIYVMRLVVK